MSYVTADGSLFEETDHLFAKFTQLHEGKQRSAWLTRRTEVTGELAKLDGYAHRSNVQDEEMRYLTHELTVLGSLIDQDDVRVRSETIARGLEAMKDPANREGPDVRADGTPMLVSGLGDRREAAAAASD